MNKNELKVGMVVELREGTRFLVINERKALGVSEWLSLDYIRHDLTHSNGEAYDIVKVYQVKLETSYFLVDMLNDCNLECIWVFKPTTNWNTISPYTKVRVRDDEFDKWRNAYFLEYNPQNGRYPFIVTYYDKFTFVKGTEIAFAMCELYEAK